MTPEKRLEALEFYRDFLERNYPEIQAERRSENQIAHLKAMIPLMQEYLDAGRIEKFMRWLGFLQGWFWSKQIFTVEELASHNRAKHEDT